MDPKMEAVHNFTNEVIFAARSLKICDSRMFRIYSTSKTTASDLRFSECITTPVTVNAFQWKLTRLVLYFSFSRFTTSKFRFRKQRWAQSRRRRWKRSNSTSTSFRTSRSSSWSANRNTRFQDFMWSILLSDNLVISSARKKMSLLRALPGTWKKL